MHIYLATGGDTLDHTEEDDDPGDEKRDNNPPVYLTAVVHVRRDVQSLPVPVVRRRATQLSKQKPAIFVIRQT